MLITSQAPLLPTGFRIDYLPHPRDYVQIKEGAPYTVPAGKIFVLTALGCTSGGLRHLRVNGAEEVLAGWFNQATYGGVADVSSVAPVPLGFTVAAGSTIEVSSGSPDGAGRACGYLASQ